MPPRQRRPVKMKMKESHCSALERPRRRELHGNGKVFTRTWLANYTIAGPRPGPGRGPVGPGRQEADSETAGPGPGPGTPGPARGPQANPAQAVTLYYIWILATSVVSEFYPILVS